MQKVEGSNPFSRSLKGLHLQVFFVNAVGWCVCIAPDRNRTRGRPTKRLARRKWLFAGSSSSFAPMTSCGGDAEGHEFDSLASPVSPELGRCAVVSSSAGATQEQGECASASDRLLGALERR